MPLDTQIGALLTRLGRPEVLALGESTHGEPAFPALRNDLFAVLVEHGYRSIALESDQVRGLAVDDWVSGGPGPRGDGRADGGGPGRVDDVLADGISHGWGAFPANRELLEWMRAWNAERPPGDRLTFHGIDAPLEYGPIPSPRPYLEHLHGYLADHLGSGAVLPSSERTAELVGDDARWNDPEAFYDAARSIGASPDAVALRAVADDLLTVLRAHTPALVAASPDLWYRAAAHGRAALGLLRYHAAAAEPADPSVRISWMLGVRDVLMADNLLAVRAREQDRGPTLVFAHNRRLQRDPSTWHQAGMNLGWSSAGAIVASRLGRRYAFVASSIGASAARGLPAPATGTFEAALPVVHGELVEPPQDTAALTQRADVTPEHGHFPLDAALLAGGDALLHVTSSPPALSVDELTRRITARPGVTCLVADEAGGAPEVSWGDRFFLLDGDERRPFATIVSRDVPGFDEASHLHRPGVHRLNIELGRRGFEREFGFPPAELPDHLPTLDAARLDTVIPHPAYGTYGWASILNPSTFDAVHHLLGQALDRRRRPENDRGRP